MQKKLEGFLNSYTVGSLLIYVVYDIWRGAFAPSALKGLFYYANNAFRVVILGTFMYGLYIGFSKCTKRPWLWTGLVFVVVFALPYLWSRVYR